ncbi:MAG: hypothetical protein K5765_09500 [Clostridia bacterium]|nr:hypothetical protein [Clostridia bacterium]
MIQIIDGVKGSGKTGRIIDAANADAEKTSGNVVFLSTTDSYRVSIKPQIKFIYTKDEGVNGKDAVVAFVKGMLAANYDITSVFVDGTLNMLGGISVKSAEFEDFYKAIEGISNKTSVKFVLSISCDHNDLPSFVK